ncbi:MAG: hypothetical protein U1F65_06825 [Verrucomicrobiota bacterium]
MSISLILIADIMARFRAWSASTGGTFQSLVYFGIVVLIALVLFIWAVMVRQQPTHRHHRSHGHFHSSDESHSGSSRGGFFRRRRRRRKKHRPVNPTLSETGGLPQPRDPKSPPPSLL